MRRWPSLLGVLAVVACARDAAELPPDVVLTEFLSAIEASTHAPNQREAAYAWLDASSQAVLTELARRTTSLAGRRMAPWEMLVPGRLSFAGPGLSRVRMQVAIEGDRAKVSIPLEKRTPAQVEQVEMVREQGRWRVVLGL